MLFMMFSHWLCHSGDLQDSVNELTEENGRLVDEKTVLLESLCTQTEKLETSRTQVSF